MYVRDFLANASLFEGSLAILSLATKWLASAILWLMAAHMQLPGRENCTCRMRTTVVVRFIGYEIREVEVHLLPDAYHVAGGLCDVLGALVAELLDAARQVGLQTNAVIMEAHVRNGVLQYEGQPRLNDLALDG